MGGNFGENLVKTLGGAAAGYIAGGGPGAGENLRNIFEGLGWSLDDLFKKPGEQAQATAEKAAPQLFEGGAATPIQPLETTPATIDPMEPLVMAGMAPLSVEPWKVQPVPAVQIAPGVNAIATPLEEVDPTPQAIWDMINQPVIREYTTAEGKQSFVTERALDAYIREEFENQMFAQMYPGLVPKEPEKDSVDRLMEPVEYFEQMDRPTRELPPGVRSASEVDTPRISDKMMMNGSFIELGSTLDQVAGEAFGMDDEYQPAEMITPERAAAKPVAKATEKKLAAAGRKQNKGLVPTEQGDTLIKEFEGFEPTAHEDGDKLAIGHGHNLTEKEERTGLIQIGDELVDWRRGINEEQAHILYLQDRAIAEDIVQKYVKVPLKRNQYSALVSFAYNVGAKPFAENKGFLKALNRGDEQSFLRRMQMYVHAQGVVLPGLQRRRAAEAALWRNGSDSD